MSDVDRIKGAVYGMALGDAWGAPTEFLSFEHIAQLQPSIPAVLKITDDTQMSIYNIYAMKEILPLLKGGEGDLLNNVELQDKIRLLFMEQHVNFAYDPDNTRAPGETCMKSLEYFSRLSFLGHQNLTGLEASKRNDSLGCGTIMRAPWLGVLPLKKTTVALLAVLQAQTTHGNPIGWLVSAIMVLLMRDMFTGKEPENLFTLASRKLEYIHSFHSNLTKTIDDKYYDNVFEVLRTHVLEWELFQNTPDDVDINTFYGGGWVADEALYNALGAAELYSSDPLLGIKRLVYSGGDSDSVAAIGGALLGVINGYEKIGYNVVDRLEPRYRKELSDVVGWLCEINSNLSDAPIK